MALARAAAAALVAVCIAVLAVVVLRQDLSAAGSAIASFSSLTWAAAAALTLVSLAAIGGIEVMLHRSAGLATPVATALRSGMTAAALGQALGFGPLVGTAVRMRLLPALGPLRAGALSGLATLAFLASGGVILALTLALALGQWGLALAVGLLSGALVSRARPLGRLPGLGPRRALAILALTAIDLVSAAMVLALFLPGLALAAPGLLLGIYLIALVLGLVMQGPGGLGAFDLALLALLPARGADVLAALAAYRLVYHLVPAALAGLWLWRGLHRRRRDSGLSPPGPAGLGPALGRAPAGDWGLVHQGGRILLTRDRAAGWLVRAAGPVLAAIGPALGRPDLALLGRQARGERRLPCLYKCDARDAAAARAAGWAVLPIATEAVLEPRRWSADLPAARGLRRKLRAAWAAGLRTEIRPDRLPHAEMAAVAADWAGRHGRERGFSMGRYSPALVRHQAVILARDDCGLAGFATFHRTGRDSRWTLDLMRWRPGAPDGTMQLLVATAIEAAGRAGVRQMSLAAVPDPAHSLRALPARLRRPLGPLARHCDAPGLRRFKAAFAPRWEPRYLCAPSRAGLVLALAAIALCVRFPPPLPVPVLRPLPGRTPQTMPPGAPAAPGHQRAAFAIAPAPMPCDAKATHAARRRLAPFRRRVPTRGQDHDRRTFPPA